VKDGKKKRVLKGMKILKIGKLSRFFEKNSEKKLGQKSLKKKVIPAQHWL